MNPKRVSARPVLPPDTPEWFRIVYERDLTRGFSQLNALQSAFHYSVALTTGDSAATSATTRQDFSKTFSLPANILVAGCVIEMQAVGLYSVSGATSGTMWLNFAGNDLATSTAIALTNPTTNDRFQGFATAEVRSIGTSGLLIPCGPAGFSNGNQTAVIGAVSASATVDTTVPLTAKASWQWSAPASGTIVLRVLTLKIHFPDRTF